MKDLFNNMNIVSKSTIRYGTVLILTLVICAFFLYVRAEVSSDPYAYITLYTDILFSLKDYVSAIYILPIVTEIILLAANEQFSN